MNSKTRIYIDVVADLFHRGHVETLKRVKGMEKDVFLLVGVHSDEVCERYKRKPFFPMEDRVEILRSCKYVDEVVENAPICITKEFINQHKIDIVVHGSDMTNFLKEVNYKVPIDMGIMKIFPYYNGISTTDIINTIYNRCSSEYEFLKLSEMTKDEWKKRKHLYTNSVNFDMDGRKSNLILVKRVLDELKLKFWLTNGTLLGAYRENDFIKWDDDVDLDLFEEDMLPLYKKLKDKFLKLGFIVRGINKKNRCKISLFRHGEKLSLRGLHLDKRYKKNEYRLRKNYKYPKKFYNTKSTIIFKGEKFLVPFPTEEFLIYVYGENWKKPINSDTESEYSTKRIKR